MGLHLPLAIGVTSMRRAAFILLLGLTTPALTAAPAGLAVSKHTLTVKNAIIDVRADYPQTGDPHIDADILATVKKIAASFTREATTTHEAKDSPFTLDVSYTIPRNDAQMFDVVFNDEWDFHGAHPNLEIVTANYFRAGGWRTYLPELFNGDAGLKRISELATADLDKRLLVPNGYSDKDWIARGVGTDWQNFVAFVLLPDALEIDYPPYQVAAYADGAQSSRLPLAGLRDVMRANPRIPVPSFDCTKARTATEHAICGDVALARLDRDVSENWSSQYANDNDPPHKAKFKATQIAWLAERDKDCNTANRVACLTTLYQARLAVLESAE
jgi:uncharacterized protein YecT (DUF1311 family)